MAADLTEAPAGCPDVATLAGFHAGRLADPDLEVVADHLATCVLCETALRSLDENPDPGRVTARLRRCLSAPPPAAGADEPGYRVMAEAAKAVWQEQGQFEVSTFPRAGPATVATAVAGLRVGPYEIIRVIGRGGMGVVYEAVHQSIRRVVALKMILAGEHARPDAVARFRKEGAAAARLDHPHVVRLYSFDDHNGLPYYAMEYVPGETLADRLQAAGPLAPRAAAELVRTLAGAVGYAHGKGVLHRDLKPANVLLAADGTAKITDFGLAKFLDDGPDGLTRTNMVLGTPSYMAPEQAAGAGEETGPVTDVYALGAILYAALTGKPPFAGGTKIETLELVRKAQLVPPSELRPGLCRNLEAVCLKALAAVPTARYTSADELADDLGRWRDGKPTAARPKGWAVRHRRGLTRAAAVAAGLLALTGGGAALAVLPDRSAVDDRLSLGSESADSPTERAALERSLARGCPVTLVGATGAPGYYRLMGYKPEFTRAGVGPDGLFRVEGHYGSKVELVPEVKWQRYTLRAEVRHERSERHALPSVGLYIGRQTFECPAGVGHAGLNVLYNDIWTRGAVVPSSAPGPVDASGQFGMIAEVVVPSKRLSPTPGTWAGPAGLFPPAGPDKPVWRTLVVSVRPGGADARFADLPAAVMTAEDFRGGFREVRHEMTKRPEFLFLNTFAPTFRPDGGLGLVAHQGRIAVRSIVISPLPE